MDPWRLGEAGLAALLDPARPLFPECEDAKGDRRALALSPSVRSVLATSEEAMAAAGRIPQTLPGDYQLFALTGDRQRYEAAYFGKRSLLAAAALRLFLGEDSLVDLVHDCLRSVCEEPTWVLPAHQGRRIDLFAAETGMQLAETLALLGDSLDESVRSRVKDEAGERVLGLYLDHGHEEDWYRGTNNWNGVCNSAVAAAFLWLEPERRRAAAGVAKALAGLEVFVRTAFAEDGSSPEGVSYWDYGLSNFVVLSEMLRARTAGAVELLAGERMRRISAYPASVRLSGSCFASFSDCDEECRFSPGIVTRLAERSGESTLLDLIAQGTRPAADWRLSALLRDALWWDGSQRPPARVADALLPAGMIARMVSDGSDSAPVVVAAKAGNNGESHNHNDLGSFIVHVDGENLLADPGRGLYTRLYFSSRRYENIFANSWGHGVPRVGGRLQEAGGEYHSSIVEVRAGDARHSVRIEMARAYPVACLARLERSIVAGGSVVLLADEFSFSGSPLEIEEAFVTWLDVTVNGQEAIVRGERHSLTMTIEAPAAASPWRAERLEQACRENQRTGVLTRLSFLAPAQSSGRLEVRMVVAGARP